MALIKITLSADFKIVFCIGFVLKNLGWKRNVNEKQLFLHAKKNRKANVFYISFKVACRTVRVLDQISTVEMSSLK